VLSEPRLFDSGDGPGVGEDPSDGGLACGAAASLSVVATDGDP